MLVENFVMPLFAHSFPPSTNEQASGKPVGHRSDYGQKQDIRFGDDDPIASGLLKNCVSLTRAALRPSTQRDFRSWLLIEYVPVVRLHSLFVQ